MKKISFWNDWQECGSGCCSWVTLYADLDEAGKITDSRQIANCDKYCFEDEELKVMVIEVFNLEGQESEIEFDL